MSETKPDVVGPSTASTAYVVEVLGDPGWIVGVFSSMSSAETAMSMTLSEGARAVVRPFQVDIVSSASS